MYSNPIPPNQISAPPPVAPVEADVTRDRLDRGVALLRRSTRFSWIVGLTVLIGAVLSIVVVTLWKPTYRSETTILYRQGVRLGGARDDRNIGNSLKEQLFARTRLEKIITDFNLYERTVDKRGMVEAVDEFRVKIDFKGKASDTFAISFIGTEPKQARDVTARLAQELVDEDTRQRREQAKATMDFLEGEKKRIGEDLKVKEKALAKFLAQHPEFAMELAAATPGASVRADRAEKMESAGDPMLQALMRQKNRLVTQASSGGAAAGDPTFVAEKASADAELAAAKQELANLQSRGYTGQHPDVQSAQARIAAAQTRVTKADAALAAANASAAEAAGQAQQQEKETRETQLKKLDGEIAMRRNQKLKKDDPTDQNSDGARIVALETEWTRLTRDVTDARTRGEELQRKVFDAEMTATSETGGYAAQLVILDPAFEPTRSTRPGRSVIVGGSVGVALLLGLLIALFCGLLDDRLYDAKDVAAVAPLLVVVPKAPRKQQRTV